MKKQLFIYSIFMMSIFFIGCDDNVEMTDYCYTQPFRENGCKNFFSYSIGQKLTFKDDEGNEDIVTIKNYELTPIEVMEQSCTTRTESFSGAFSLEYKTSNQTNELKTIDINLWSETDMGNPYFEIFNPELFHASLSTNGYGSITRNYQFEHDGKIYPLCLKVSVNNEESDIEEFGLTDEDGLIYFKINGKIRTLVK